MRWRRRWKEDDKFSRNDNGDFWPTLINWRCIHARVVKSIMTFCITLSFPHPPLLPFPLITVLKIDPNHQTPPIPIPQCSKPYHNSHHYIMLIAVISLVIVSTSNHQLNNAHQKVILPITTCNLHLSSMEIRTEPQLLGSHRAEDYKSYNILLRCGFWTWTLCVASRCYKL